jgi:hypothetical protein
MSRRLDELHKYQWRMIDWILDNPKCALWAGVGLGKTVTTLTALQILLDRKIAKKILIIAPLRVAKFVWPAEMKNWTHLKDLRHVVLHGAKKNREELINSHYEIHIINKEMVTWLVDEMSARNHWPYDTVVIDESTCVKSNKSKRYKSLRRVYTQTKRMIQLSATPAPNGLLDLWAQMHLLDKGKRLELTMSKYKDKYFIGDYMGFNFVPKEGAPAHIYKQVADKCLTLTSKDYLELPKCNYNTINIEMDKKMAEKYNELEKEFVLVMDEGTITASQAAVLSGKLLQFCGGAVYIPQEFQNDMSLNHIGESKTWVELSTLKLEALQDLVSEMAGQPLLVAYNYRHELERLVRAFPNGRCLNSQKDEDDWNKKKIPLLFVHPQSCGHGLNLQYGGSNLVWFGTTWNLELYEQLNGRLDRQGQSDPVFIHHLILNNTIEERVMLRLADKSITQEDLLNAMKEKYKNG